MHAVRRIRAGEWVELREIRLRLLSDVPWRASDLAVERTYGQARWEERAEIAATASDRAAFVAVKPSVWVGIVEAFSEDGTAAEIAGFWVSPAWRRRGVGLALLGAAAEWAGARGLPRLVSWVRERNQPAIAAHARAGFVASGEVIRWPRRSDWQILMVRDLVLPGLVHEPRDRPAD